MKSITQEELDWFAEGELSLEERDDLFRRLDDDPSGWKSCALALLERQALQRSLLAIGCESSVAQVTDGVDLDSGENVLRATGRKVGVESHLGSKVGKHEAGSGWNLVGMLALATGLTWLIVGLQYWIHDSGPADRLDSANRVADATIERQATPTVPVAFKGRQLELLASLDRTLGGIGIKDGKIMAVVSLTIGSEQVMIPVIESETLRTQVEAMPPVVIPAGLPEKLARSGYRLQPNRQFLSVNRQDGTNEVMPMNMLDCRYVGKAIF